MLQQSDQFANGIQSAAIVEQASKFIDWFGSGPDVYSIVSDQNIRFVNCICIWHCEYECMWNEIDHKDLVIDVFVFATAASIIA